MTSTSLKQWLTVTEAAEYMAVSTDTVRRLIADRRLAATYFTERSLRVSREAIEELARKNSTR